MIGDVITLAQTGYQIAKAIYEQVETYKLNQKEAQSLKERVSCVVTIIETIRPQDPQTLDGLNHALKLLNTHLTEVQLVVEKASHQQKKWEQLKQFFKAQDYQESLISVNQCLDRCVQLVGLGVDTQLMKNYEASSTAFLNALKVSQQAVLGEIEQLNQSQTVQVNELAEIRASLNKFYTELMTSETEVAVDRLRIGNDMTVKKNASVEQGNISHHLAEGEGELSERELQIIDDELKRQEKTRLDTENNNRIIIEEGGSLKTGDVTSARVSFKKTTTSSTSSASHGGLFATPKPTQQTTNRPASAADKKAIQAIIDILNQAYPEQDADNRNFRQEMQDWLQNYQGRGLTPDERQALKDKRQELAQALDDEEVMASHP